MKTKKFLSAIVLWTFAFSNFWNINFAFGNLSEAEEKLCKQTWNLDELFFDKNSNVFALFNASNQKYSYEEEFSNYNNFPDNFYLVKNWKKIWTTFSYLTSKTNHTIPEKIFSNDWKLALIDKNEKVIVDWVNTNIWSYQFYANNKASNNGFVVPKYTPWDNNFKIFNWRNYKVEANMSNFPNVEYYLEDSACKADLEWSKTQLNYKNETTLYTVSDNWDFYFVKDHQKFWDDSGFTNVPTEVYKLLANKTSWQLVNLQGKKFLYIDRAWNIYSYNENEKSIYKNNSLYISNFKWFDRFWQDAETLFLNKNNVIQEKNWNIYFISRTWTQENDFSINLTTKIYKNGTLSKTLSSKVSTEDLKNYFGEELIKKHYSFFNSDYFLQDSIDSNGNLYTHILWRWVNKILKNGKSLCENVKPDDNNQNWNTNQQNPDLKNSSAPNPESMVLKDDNRVLSENKKIEKEAIKKEKENRKEFFEILADYKEIYHAWNWWNHGLDNFLKDNDIFLEDEHSKIVSFISNIFKESTYETVKSIHKKFWEKRVQELSSESKFISHFVEEFNGKFQEIEEKIDSIIYNLPQEQIKKIKTRVKNFIKENREQLAHVYDILKKDLRVKNKLETSESIMYVISVFNDKLIEYKIVTEDLDYLKKAKEKRNISEKEQKEYEKIK